MFLYAKHICEMFYESKSIFHLIPGLLGNLLSAQVLVNLSSCDFGFSNGLSFFLVLNKWKKRLNRLDQHLCGTFHLTPFANGGPLEMTPPVP